MSEALYPATFITTADHDDREVPAHSFKFAARLQSAQAGPDPVIIRIETNAGHGAEPCQQINRTICRYFRHPWNMGIKELKLHGSKVLRANSRIRLRSKIPLRHSGESSALMQIAGAYSQTAATLNNSPGQGILFKTLMN